MIGALEVINMASVPIGVEMCREDKVDACLVKDRHEFLSFIGESFLAGRTARISKGILERILVHQDDLPFLLRGCDILFSLPKNGDDKLANHYYSFDWGDVHFTVLDTSLVEEKQWVPDLFEKEKAWAEKDITSSKKKWKVVLSCQRSA